MPENTAILQVGLVALVGWEYVCAGPVKYNVVEGREEKEFAVGSDLVPLDEPMLVRFEQRGAFPLLEPLIPQESELEVLVTRDLVMADRWVRDREKEKVEWIGYTVHERIFDLKRGSQLAYIPDPTVPATSAPSC